MDNIELKIMSVRIDTSEWLKNFHRQLEDTERCSPMESQAKRILTQVYELLSDSQIIGNTPEKTPPLIIHGKVSRIENGEFIPDIIIKDD